MQTAKIPATIVTGFLGSGKTTLLRHILENANGRRIAVIVNEFGELGIDGEILKGCGIGCDEQGEPTGQLYELANGCLCCTVQEEFFPVMEQLLERRDQIDHVLIETSGLALPKPLVQAFHWPSIRNAFTVDSVVTVVDGPAAAAGQFAANPVAVDAQRRADPNLDHESPLHELFEDQLASADLVILNKTDLMDAAQIAAVEALVRPEIPAEVKIVPAQAGSLDVNSLLGLNRASEETIHQRVDHHGSADDADHADHHHDEFDSVVVEAGTVDREALVGALQKLVADHTIYRVKGFAELPGKAMRLVLHGVGQRFDSYFDRAWRADEARGTRVVLIGQELDGAALQAALDQALAG
ncbi:cobalamin biosynthesis protein CobW [Cupriavidus sp. OV038]|jgi:cobalamin biosynthesis protein CobW|uniref:cobalamin biosynthesis protein CobW n=1 Tax=unclassified Cupriavidus TaxID=2640874 RepID=UPI0008ECD793|nr:MULTISPECIES: cobalamin biosynthesis protein CobW [unclassified Cupriavidus]SFC55725.1 cobalamin biosynthesis protein CobW [Cupriavidus sp. OV038]SFP46704.1 cobalamin biosynthesis protein CobW [Cupriavidus sp. OV096]